MIEKREKSRAKPDNRLGLLGQRPKWFALASVTALGGLVAAVNAAGCSTSSSGDNANPDKTPPSNVTTDASATEPEPNNGSDAAANACKAKISFTAEDIKPAAAQANVCGADIVTALADACAKDPNAQACTDAREAPANQACAACIFGKKDDQEWKVVNLMPGETPGARYNQEGCIDHITGVTGCGSSYVSVLECFNDFCAKCPQDQARSCVEDVASNECKSFLINDKKCGDALVDDELAVDGCFPSSADEAGVKSLFVYLSRIALGRPRRRTADDADSSEEASLE